LLRQAEYIENNSENGLSNIAAVEEFLGRNEPWTQ
jgi:hypothetical protein